MPTNEYVTKFVQFIDTRNNRFVGPGLVLLEERDAELITTLDRQWRRAVAGRSAMDKVAGGPVRIDASFFSDVKSHLQQIDAPNRKDILALDNVQLYYTVTDWVVHCRRHYKKSINYAQDDLGIVDGARLYQHGGLALVGPMDPEQRASGPTWTIHDAPLFTDGQPNADMLNY